MMQTSKPARPTTPARTLLSCLSPQLRQRVVQLLRETVGRLQQALREQLRALDECTADTPLMNIDMISAEDGPMLEGLSGVLQALLEQQLGQHPMAPHSVVMQNNPSSATSRLPLPDLQEQDEMDTQRRRRTATSSITGDAESLASTRLDTTCDALDHRMDLLLLETNPDQRHGILRSLVHRLLIHLHGASCRMRIILQIIARRQPQPTLTETTNSSVESQASELCSDLLQQLNQLRADVAELPETVPMGQKWAVQQLPLLGPFALDCMSFLECGEYNSSHPDDADTQTLGSNEEYVPGLDRMRNNPDFQEAMITAIPGIGQGDPRPARGTGNMTTSRGSAPITTTPTSRTTRGFEKEKGLTAVHDVDTQEYPTTTRTPSSTPSRKDKMLEDKKGKRVRKGAKKTIT